MRPVVITIRKITQRNEQNDMNEEKIYEMFEEMLTKKKLIIQAPTPQTLIKLI